MLLMSGSGMVVVRGGVLGLCEEWFDGWWRGCDMVVMMLGCSYGEKYGGYIGIVIIIW